MEFPVLECFFEILFNTRKMRNMQSVITIAYSAQNRQAEIYSYNRSPKETLLKISGSKHTKL